jgi:hypothetical protein
VEVVHSSSGSGSLETEGSSLSAANAESSTGAVFTDAVMADDVVADAVMADAVMADDVVTGDVVTDDVVTDAASVASTPSTLVSTPMTSMRAWRTTSP